MTLMTLVIQADSACVYVLVIREYDVVRRSGCSDHFVTMCVDMYMYVGGCVC